MRRGDDLDPLIHRDAAARDPVADLLVEDLRRCSRQGAEPRRPQGLEILGYGQAGAEAAVQHLLRGEGVQMHLGHGGLDGPAEVDVVRAVELGGQPRLDAHLGGAHLPGLHGAADDFLQGKEVSLLLAVVAAEGAEGAVLDAHVGEVDVAIDDVGDEVAGLPEAHLVRHEGEGVQLPALDLGEPHALVDGQLLAVQGMAENAAHVAGDPVEADGRGRGLRRSAVVQFHVRHLSSSDLTRPPPSTRAATRGRSDSSRNSGRDT